MARDADVARCFASGQSGPSADESKVTIAQLSQRHVLMLLNNSDFPNTQVLLKEPLVLPDKVEMYYNIDLNTKQPKSKILDLHITHLADVSTAKKAMKEYLADYDSNINVKVKATRRSYGNCSLEDRSTVFWWYLRHFVRVSASTSGSPDLEAARSIATTFNQHLMGSETDDIFLVRPQPGISGRESVTIVQGATQKLIMKNVTGTDETKRVMIDKPDVIVVTQLPTASGILEVYGRQPGTAQVVVLVAHADYLTVNSVQFTVTVGHSTAAPASA